MSTPDLRLLTGGAPANNQLVRPSTTGLAFVRGDSVFEVHRRVGRFALDRAAAASQAHLYSAIEAMQEKMISGLAKRGYQYMGESFELRGPLDHIEFSENAAPDPGPQAQPDPRDSAALAAWERAERARIARKVGQDDDDQMVDYELVTSFRVKVQGDLRRVA